jgi:hypothetical protein
MIPRTVNYLLARPCHAPYLLTSISSLRRHFQGDILIWCWPESVEISRSIAKVFSSTLVSDRFNFEYKGRHYPWAMHKIEVILRQGGVFLDADTLIQKPIDPLFDYADSCQLTFTQFCRWTTDKRFMRRRIETLKKVPSIDKYGTPFKKRLSKVLATSHPSINTGVVASYPAAPVVQQWRWWALQAAKHGIWVADETTAQPMQCSPDVGVMPGLYNCSTMLRYFKEEGNDVVIWHGHGHTFSQRTKSPRGFSLWEKEFTPLYLDNVGDVQGWLPTCGNRWIDLEGE